MRLFREKNIANISIISMWYDRLLEVLAILSFPLLWIVTFFYVKDLASTSPSWLTWVFLSIITIPLFLYRSYAPFRWVRFPFQVTERNQWIQFLFVKRDARIGAIELNLLFLVGMFTGMESFFGVNDGFFRILFIAVLLIFILSKVGYYYLAWRYR